MSDSPPRLAAQLLDCCRSGQPYPAWILQSLVEQALGDDPVPATRALFRDLVEPLSDSFEPSHCDAYSALFADVIAQALPNWTARELRARHQRVRSSRPVSRDYDRVLVLSRVTLGADVAVTSVVLDAVKKRFPNARIGLVGSAKAHELWAADPRIHHVPAPYSRTGALMDRLRAGLDLRALIPGGALVVDPDSRLSQLGLMPVCDDRDYLFFESRSAGGDDEGASLGELTRRWVEQVLGVGDARAYIAPGCGPVVEGSGWTAMSLGVGENPAKRVPDPFEEQLVEFLLSRGERLVIDQGAGGEEADRVRKLASRFPGRVQTFQGAFAPFAATIARASLYVGYDSSGQHVAAATGTPLITVFAGFVSERMRARWTPTGPGPIRVVPVGVQDSGSVVADVAGAYDSLAGHRIG
jgi:hypothetical protein